MMISSIKKHKTKLGEMVVLTVVARKSEIEVIDMFERGLLAHIFPLDQIETLLERVLVCKYQHEVADHG